MGVPTNVTSIVGAILRPGHFCEEEAHKYNNIKQVVRY